MRIPQNNQFEILNNTMSSKADSPSNAVVNANDPLQCNDIDSETIKNLPSFINESVAKKLEFVDKEKLRRSKDNRIYREKVQVEKGETVYQRRKRLRLEKESNQMADLLQPVDLIINNLLNKELTRILQYEISERLVQAQHNFRWVMCTLNSKVVFTLQFMFQPSCYIDVLCCKQSNLKKAGYGLFACNDFPKGAMISVYLGRLVKENNKQRCYLMEMSRKFVKKRNGDTYWDRTRTARAPFIIDALMSESYSQWNTKRELHLGAHLLNDLDYNTPSNTTPPNCIVQPLLEVVTARDVKKGEELYISYNRN